MSNFAKEPEPDTSTEVGAIQESAKNLKRIQKAHDPRGKRLSKAVEARTSTKVVGTHSTLLIELPTLLDVDGPPVVASAVCANTAEFTALDAPEMYALRAADPGKTLRAERVNAFETAGLGIL